MDLGDASTQYRLGMMLIGTEIYKNPSIKNESVLDFRFGVKRFEKNEGVINNFVNLIRDVFNYEAILEVLVSPSQKVSINGREIDFNENKYIRVNVNSMSIATFIAKDLGENIKNGKFKTGPYFVKGLIDMGRRHSLNVPFGNEKYALVHLPLKRKKNLIKPISYILTDNDIKHYLSLNERGITISKAKLKPIFKLEIKLS